jgi:hypothetical protein
MPRASALAPQAVSGVRSLISSKTIFIDIHYPFTDQVLAEANHLI